MPARSTHAMYQYTSITSFEIYAMFSRDVSLTFMGAACGSRHGCSIIQDLASYCMICISSKLSEVLSTKTVQPGEATIKYCGRKIDKVNLLKPFAAEEPGTMWTFLRGVCPHCRSPLSTNMSVRLQYQGVEGSCLLSSARATSCVEIV